MLIHALIIYIAYVLIPPELQVSKDLSMLLKLDINY